MEKQFEHLKKVIDSYYPISDKTFESVKKCLNEKKIDKGEILCLIGDTPNSFYFVHQGLLRAYIIGEKGNEYNKTFFDEGTFPGSMVALLRNEASLFEIQALEDSHLLEIDFNAYRKLLHNNEEIKLFHIYYLERHWLMYKEAKEVALIQEDATSRYETFLETFPQLENRLPQYHIASHLGITPTQLSRIRKNR